MVKVLGDPAVREVGRLRVDVAAGPIARMFAAEEWQRPENAGGGAVFAGRVTKVVENVEVEPDPADRPLGLFNLDAHIHDTGSGYPVPYLRVRADVTRDGAPVLTGLPLLPVARPSKGAAGLHYGNNVALDPHGVYQVMVQLAPSALTGTERPALLEFALDFDRGDGARA
ncbi:iron transporter [Segeticoccus rhizosphaerae]|uniref:iron transporter n=1 Tax=Segeticoccus rhizosphaerae TaxID=1104777 RepID=UPI0013905DB2|nr:iron transporter [Ornithinicoccus soli]